MNSKQPHGGIDDSTISKVREIFMAESLDQLEDCAAHIVTLMDAESQAENVDRVYRVYHTIKASASMIRCTELEKFAHKAEQFLEYLRLGQKLSKADVMFLLQINDALTQRINVLKEFPEVYPAWGQQGLLDKLAEKLRDIQDGVA